MTRRQRLELALGFVLVAFVIAAAMYSSGCTSAQMQQLPATAAAIATPEQAARAYVLAGQIFDSSMNVLVELRRQHKLTDAQWAAIDAAQIKINKWGPKVGDGITAWREQKTRYSFDVAYDQLAPAVLELKQSAEVPR